MRAPGKSDRQSPGAQLLVLLYRCSLHPSPRLSSRAGCCPQPQLCMRNHTAELPRGGCCKVRAPTSIWVLFCLVFLREAHTYLFFYIGGETANKQGSASELQEKWGPDAPWKRRGDVLWIPPHKHIAELIETGSPTSLENALTSYLQAAGRRAGKQRKKPLPLSLSPSLPLHFLISNSTLRNLPCCSSCCTLLGQVSVSTNQHFLSKKSQPALVMSCFSIPVHS